MSEVTTMIHAIHPSRRYTRYPRISYALSEVRPKSGLSCMKPAWWVRQIDYELKHYYLDPLADPFSTHGEFAIPTVREYDVTWEPFLLLLERFPENIAFPSFRFEAMADWRGTWYEIHRMLERKSRLVSKLPGYFTLLDNLCEQYFDKQLALWRQKKALIFEKGDWSVEQYRYWAAGKKRSSMGGGGKHYSDVLADDALFQEHHKSVNKAVRSYWNWLEGGDDGQNSIYSQLDDYYFDCSFVISASRSRVAQYLNVQEVLSALEATLDSTRSWYNQFHKRYTVRCKKFRVRPAGGGVVEGKAEYPLYKLPARKEFYPKVRQYISAVLGVNADSIHLLEEEGLTAYIALANADVNRLVVFDTANAECMEAEGGLILSVGRRWTQDLGKRARVKFTGGFATRFNSTLAEPLMLKAFFQFFGITLAIEAIWFGGDNWALLFKTPSDAEQFRRALAMQEERLEIFSTGPNERFLGFSTLTKSFFPLHVSRDGVKHTQNWSKGLTVKQVANDGVRLSSATTNLALSGVGMLSPVVQMQRILNECSEEEVPEFYDLSFGVMDEIESIVEDYEEVKQSSFFRDWKDHALNYLNDVPSHLIQRDV